MFSGLVESTQKIEKITSGAGSLSFFVSRPSEFQDLKVGDSIAVNGVCLTLEEFNTEWMKFTLAAETLKVLYGSVISSPEGLRLLIEKILERPVNLERSLQWGDRVHGHMVSGHVEGLGEVVRSEAQGDSWFMDVACPPEFHAFLWKKGSVTLQGVSLTVNEFKDGILQVCLIPETLKKTNLGFFRPGDQIHLETDLTAKSMIRLLDSEELLKKIAHRIQELGFGGSR